MSASRKSKYGNPARKVDPLVDAVYKRLVSGVKLTGELEPHITPLGRSLITLEQWRYLRGSVVSDMALYAHLTGKPSPIDIIVKSEQARVEVEF